MDLTRRLSVPSALLLLSFSAAACGGEEPSPSAGNGECVTRYDAATDYFPVKQTLRHAENFTLEYAKNYQVVTVGRPTAGGGPQKIVLVRCGTPAPPATGGLAGALVLEVPVQSVFSGSTTHLPFITSLGALSRLKGVASAGFVTSPEVRERVERGAVVEYAPGQEVDVEKVVSAAPDVLVTDGTEQKGYGPLRRAGITILPAAEWLEPSPLGRAEWIKYFAALTGAEERAAQVYDRIADDYEALAKRTRNTPKATVLPGSMFSGQWNMPNGGSFLARLIADAGGTYAWASRPGTGTTSLDLETVLAQAADARVWISGDQSWKSLDDVRKADERYTEFAAFGTGEVWSSNKALGPGGGNDYHERGVARPDLVLADLVAILHPDLRPGHEFAFYRKMAP